jgi:hypothetical protein
MPNRLFSAVLLAILLATGARAEGRLESRYSRVGIISFDLPEGRSTGTAFQTGFCTVMTNFHVVFGPWYVTALRPPSPSVTGTVELTGVTLPGGRHPTTRVKPVAWGDYQGPDRQFRKPGEDWVILVSEDCLGYDHGYVNVIDLAHDDDTWTGTFESVGYSAGTQMIDTACAARPQGGGGLDEILVHNCVAYPGDSGAPIFRKGTSRVVAMTSGVRSTGSVSCQDPDTGALTGDKTCSNSAVRLRHDIISRISAIDADALTQFQLARAGYEVGTFGAIDRPRFHDAIRAVQHQLGFTVDGEASCALAVMIQLAAVRH